MKTLKYNDMTKEAFEQLSKGAFLTTKYKGVVNTMTIAWGNIGFMWKKPIFTVMVRPSRHTYSMIEGSDNFTVSIPINEDMKKALSYCGTRSGKDVDKFTECGLELIDAQVVETPIISNCSLHYECKIVARQELKPACIVEEIAESSYHNGDLHTLYYGEIVACYLSK